ncbi:MAG: helicase-related protein, partial [Bacteroidota bacterium]|nr:helicase-related protein [Bacteroidota bacterium]
DFGFRLPAALDNRPLKFDEFESMINQTIYVSATPSDYELEKCGGVIVEQIIRPTGLLDPKIIIKPRLNQIDDLINEIDQVIKRDERVLVTTLTKRMAEELDKYLTKLGKRTRYIHSDVETLKRVEILADLRNGLFDVLIGVNLLREGLDLPEVSLVAILDADKEGFLRSERSLVQTVGRAARNVNGKVIMYADKVTKSMAKTIDETNRRRGIQEKYNSDNKIIPTQIYKTKESILASKKSDNDEVVYEVDNVVSISEDPVVKKMNRDELESSIKRVKSQMEREAKKENFIEAAHLRDELFSLKKILLEKYN